MTALALALLLALALSGRAAFGSWAAPGAFFSLYWTVAMGAPLLFAPEEPVGAAALLWVGVSACAVSVGSYLGGGLGQGLAATGPRDAAWYPYLRRALAIAAVGCAIVGLGGPLIPLIAQGYGLRVLFSLTDLVRAAAELSIGRYTETYTPPLLGQAALPFLYAGPAFGGALAALGCRRIQRLAVVLPFVPAVLMTVTQTQRAVTIAATTIWISSYLAARVLAGRVDLFNRGHIIAGTLAGALALVLFFGAALARLGTTDLLGLAEVAPSIHGGLFGHATAFGQWFETGGPGAASPSWGAFTFAGLYDALGLGQRRLGLFPDSVVLSSGDETNIYTVFRPLIDDFTLIGALLALAVLGALGGVAFRAARRGHPQAVPVLAGFYATTLYGLITSIWIYNSIMAAFLMFSVSGSVAGRFRRPRVSATTHAEPNR